LPIQNKDRHGKSPNMEGKKDKEEHKGKSSVLYTKR
jgi:hypothetical protein